MPLITVNLRRGTTIEYRRAVSESIHRAMVDVLKIPEDDQFHVFNELDAENMIHQDVAFGLPRGERFMFIQLAFNHRTPEQKRALYSAIVANLAQSPGVPEADIGIVVLETASENWWAAGRMVNPATGYDARMTDVPTAAGASS